MTTRTALITLLLLTFLAGCDARAQIPDATGKYKYAGQACSWDRYNTAYEVRYGTVRGHIRPAGYLNSVEWEIVHPPRFDSAGSCPSVDAAFRALCPHMIELHALATSPSILAPPGGSSIAGELNSRCLPPRVR